MRGVRVRIPAALAALALVLVGCSTGGDGGVDEARPADPVALEGERPVADPPAPGNGWSAEVDGVLTFRGNPTRTYYGEGPVPEDPVVLWSFPDGAMCSPSTVGSETKTWCGMGWTGQPSVWERDGRTWVAFGAYDRSVHFLDGVTGERLLPDFPTGDIIKGSVTVDPDGFPLLYTGSRDGNYRVIALDRDQPTELWRLNAHDVGPTMWNDDWDGSGLILDDLLIEGGENSRFHAARLRRDYGPDGLVTVAPEIEFDAAGWDDQLLADVGDRQVSIENSVAVFGDVAYFANSGGLVQGWDLAPLQRGEDAVRVFRYWAGDDVDASVVIDEAGMLYVGVEYERHTARSTEVGQILKLDPRAPEPLVWSVPETDVGLEGKAGIWGTPALYRDLVIVPTHGGRVLALDRDTGALRWEMGLPGPVWQSPVVVDDVLVQGDCSGVLHGFDVSDTSVKPPELWRVELGGCIESTPVVWKGRIYIGTRGGYFHALGDRG